ncbi:MAG: AbrB/MazE/SpoVT family DNA-binding domain-containing protein [Actinobacteria bacterium]|uniref:SpoVT-AbrB domain-containing protein n=1 Tax=Nostocoides veronense TaxID=330836 RepID=A0ABN2L932_9MICO|nr:AbrB/MazE/SpoVT family DNA-binding domain-containing protein [Actinomycetota bacterium]
MKTTIDRAGRLVIPRELRAQVGLSAGDVRVTVVGSGVFIEPIAHDDVEEEEGRLVIPSKGLTLTADAVGDLRYADQK